MNVLKAMEKVREGKMVARKYWEAIDNEMEVGVTVVLEKDGKVIEASYRNGKLFRPHSLTLEYGDIIADDWVEFIPAIGSGLD